MNHTEKFTGKAEMYQKFRPAYPSAYIRYLTEKIPANGTVADIGAGTGILSKALLREGYFVYCVEPNADMRKIAAETLAGDFQIVNAAAERTALSKNSVDLVVAAQAFHWFDAKAFRRECGRILRPGGIVSLVWNTRRDSALERAAAEAAKQYCPAYQGASGGIRFVGESFGTFFEDGVYEHCEFDNSYSADRETFIGRILSSSYSLKPEDTKYEAWLASLHRIFDRFCERDRVAVSIVTQSYTGKVSSEY